MIEEYRLTEKEIIAFINIIKAIIEESEAGRFS